MLELFDRQLDLIQRISIGDPDIALSGITKRVAWDKGEVFFIEQLLTEFFTLQTCDLN